MYKHSYAQSAQSHSEAAKCSQFFHHAYTNPQKNPKSYHRAVIHCKVFPRPISSLGMVRLIHTMATVQAVPSVLTLVLLHVLESLSSPWCTRTEKSLLPSGVALGVGQGEDPLQHQQQANHCYCNPSCAQIGSRWSLKQSSINLVHLPGASVMALALQKHPTLQHHTMALFSTEQITNRLCKSKW